MDTQKLIPVIAVVSGVVTVIWGTLANDWSQSWLALFAGGIAVTILSILNRDKPEKEDGEEKENGE